MYTTVERIKGYLPVDIDGLSFNDPTYADEIDYWGKFVDDYLANAYRVPFPDYPNTPRMISVVTELLVVYNLYVRSGMASDKDDPRVNLWSRAHKLLNQIKSGDVVLAGAGDSSSGAEIMYTDAVIASPPATGPMSFTNQNRELGPPHARTYGGLPLKSGTEEP